MQLIVERMCSEYHWFAVNLAQRYTTAVTQEYFPQGLCREHRLDHCDPVDQAVEVRLAYYVRH